MTHNVAAARSRGRIRWSPLVGSAERTGERNAQFHGSQVSVTAPDPNHDSTLTGCAQNQKCPASSEALHIDRCDRESARGVHPGGSSRTAVIPCVVSCTLSTRPLSSTHSCRTAPL